MFNTLIVSNCVVAFVVDLFVMEDENEADTESDGNMLIANVQSRYGCSKRVKVQRHRTTADQIYAPMFKERIEKILAGDES